MKNYFTISEFAKLRDININSLRYYEKLGILKPAYIDEQTKYRYYSPEQVSLLNKIILCINLGIPLKEMVGYIDEEGNLNSQKLLERGRSLALKRMQEMQSNLNYIEFSLKNIEESKAFVDETGTYLRKIGERCVIATDYIYFHPEREIKEVIVEVSRIYKKAMEMELFPSLPAGQILEFQENGEMKSRFFLEIMNHEVEDEQIYRIPAGTYACSKIELGPDIDLKSCVKSVWDVKVGDMIVLDNVAMEKYSFTSKPSELQYLYAEV